MLTLAERGLPTYHRGGDSRDSHIAYNSGGTMNQKRHDWASDPTPSGFSHTSKRHVQTIDTRSRQPAAHNAYFPRGSGWNSAISKVKRTDEEYRDYIPQLGSVAEFFSSAGHSPAHKTAAKPRNTATLGASKRAVPHFTSTPVPGKQPLFMYPCPTDVNGNAIDSYPQTVKHISDQRQHICRLAMPKYKRSDRAEMSVASTGSLKLAKSTTGIAPGGFASTLRR
jgi:hypothetical protein